MRDKLQVGVLFGGRSGEHEVSLMSAKSVLDTLSPEKYQITQVGITKNGEWLVGGDVLTAFNQGNFEGLDLSIILPDPSWKGLYVIRPDDHNQVLRQLTALDVAFPVLHGSFGEDGTLQGLFEMANLAYVGAGVLGSALGMDKGVFKDVMRAHDLPVLESLVVLRRDIQANMDRVLGLAEDLAPYPLFTKPANMGSSVGISKCHNRSDLLEGLLDAVQYDRRVLIERGINGREIEVSVLGNENPQASVPGEIVPAAEFYTYEAKYHDDRSQLLIPAPLNEQTTATVRQLAVRAFEVIDGAGMARVDFLLDRDTGDLFINELNTIPGFTRISMYPKLWDYSGLPYPSLLDRLIELALERKGENDRSLRHYERMN